MTNWNGLGVERGTLPRLSTARSRSISAENPHGEKGGGARAVEGTMAKAARDLGVGWKISPCIDIEAGETALLADITGPGSINHIWITVDSRRWRSLLLRVYWDDEESPSIEVPLGDFFCLGWNQHAQISAIPVSVNPEGRLQQLLGNAVSRARQDHGRERRRLVSRRLLLPGGLRADRGS